MKSIATVVVLALAACHPTAVTTLTPAPRFEQPVFEPAPTPAARPAISVGAPVNLKYKPALPSRSNRGLQLGLGLGIGIGVPVVVGAVVGLTYLIMAAVGAGFSALGQTMSHLY